MAPPKFATPRDPSRPSLGGRQAKFAQVWLGKPLTPAQRLVADVGGELLPNGLPAYPLVVVTQQRRAGKSHLSTSQVGERCLSVPGFQSWYTAQDGGAARDEFLKFGELVDNAPLGKVVRTLVGNGREVMKFPNGSRFRPHPPTETSLHGKDCDRNDVDEAWAFTEEEGRLLMQAIGPTHLARPMAQTFIWSAGGTAMSTWLAKLVARGRAGRGQGMAYFEWGIPDDADPEDLQVIADHHPAFGHHVTLESLAALRATFDEDDTAGWARAAGNRWTEVIGGAIDARTWASVRHPDPIPDDVPLGWGAARAEDGSQVAIACAAQLEDFIVVEVVEVLPSPYMAAEHVAGWAQWQAVGVSPTGPSAGLFDDLSELHANVTPMSGRVESAAVANFLDALPSRRIRFREHPALDEAVRVAAKRRVAEGGYAWARSAAGAQVAPLEAATNAVWALTHSDTTSVPIIDFGGTAA